jgi:hypothetical protein
LNFAPTGIATQTGNISLSTGAGLKTTALSGIARSNVVQSFAYTKTIDTSFTVPQSGTYVVEAQGASSGPNSTNWGVRGTGGAYLKCSMQLVAGTNLKILVGGAGSTVSGNISGGGGSFVATAANLPLMVAGGGGGGWANYTGGGGTVTNKGTAYVGAGGGFINDGKGGARSFVNGGAGGTDAGGFGGGGPMGGSYGSWSGGGGYSGGGSYQYSAEGGGSYCSGALVTGTDNANYNSNGWVKITY